MASIQKVTVAGASGHLGSFLVAELLAAKFTVTALTREESKSTFPSSVKVVPVNYDSLESLTSALKDQDAVISVLATMANTNQSVLIDAAAAAGVQRFVPSHIGADLRNAKAASLPCFHKSAAMLKYLEQKCMATSRMTWTVVNPGIFMDMALHHGLILNDQFCDGGNRPFSGTSMPTLAKAIVALLKHSTETKNRNVCVHEAVLTQRKLAAIAERKTGQEWKAEFVDTAELEKPGYQELAKENPNRLLAMISLVKCSIFAEGYGGEHEQVDNELLGVRMMSESEIEAFVGKNLPK